MFGYLSLRCRLESLIRRIGQSWQILRRGDAYMEDRWMPYEREMIAVQEGIAKHRAMSLTSSEATAEYRLRRNIHRIEKGIAVADGKRAFAEDYLGDTVCILSNLLHSMTGCHGDNWELTTWAIRMGMSPILLKLVGGLGFHFNVVPCRSLAQSL